MRVWGGPAAVGAVIAVAYIVFGALQWSRFTVRSWDLAIFTQLLQRYAHLEAPIVPVKGDGYNLLGDHFHPLLAIFAPIFALFPYAFTLIVLQALCFALSAAIFALAVQRRLGRASGVALGLAFGLSWGIQYAGEAQFHEIALAVPLLTLGLIAMFEKRWRAALLWSAPLVFVKEDLGFTVAAIGVVIVLLTRKPFGLWLSAWGLGWFAIATMIVLPLLNPAGEWASAGNATPLAVLGDPALLFSPIKGETILLLLVITAGLLLRSPLALIMLPTLAWRFLSSNEGYWAPTWHYSAVLMPIAFVALLDGIDRTSRSRHAWLRSYGLRASAIATTVAVMLLPGLPLKLLVDPAAWTPPERAAAAEQILAAVPVGATVETDIGLMNNLVDDHVVFWLGNDNPVPDCLVIDHVSGGTPSEWGSALDIAQRLHPGTEFAVVAAVSDYELVCRP